MKTKNGFEAKYIIAGSEGDFRFFYYCALCNRSYTSGWIMSGEPEVARLLADKEARKYFNRCCECGQWVCDEHYNRDEMMCVACAPIESQRKK